LKISSTKISSVADDVEGTYKPKIGQGSLGFSHPTNTKKHICTIATDRIVEQIFESFKLKPLFFVKKTFNND